jgi:hypothetical protein
VHQLLGEVAIVGEDEQPFRIAVEAPDVVERAERFGQQGVNGFAAEFVFAGADVSAGFVEDDDHGLARGDAFAIDADVIGLGDAGSHVDTRRAVDFDAASLDELVTLAARPDGAGSEVFVEAATFFHGAGE